MQKSDLSFEMPDGRIITSFANNSQRHAVKEYNNARQEYLQAVEHLQNLYSQFRRNPVDSLRPDIFEAEADCDRLGALSRELYQKATEILSK